MKSLLFIVLCLLTGCQYNQTTTQSIESIPGNEVEIGKKALRFAERNQTDSIVNLFDDNANVSAASLKPLIEKWKPTFDYYIFPDNSNIRVSKTVSKGIDGTQELITVIYPYTDGTDSPTKNFVITFLNEKIVRIELQETKMIKLF